MVSSLSGDSNPSCASFGSATFSDIVGSVSLLKSAIGSVSTVDDTGSSYSGSLAAGFIYAIGSDTWVEAAGSGYLGSLATLFV